MNIRANVSHRRNSAARRTAPLAFEQLESRAMLAMDVIETGLGSLLSLDAADAVHVEVTRVANSAPKIVSPVRMVSGSAVTTRTAQFAVAGSDDQGDANLKYRWQTVTAPAGGYIWYGQNNTTAAKSNTLTFNRAGTYSLRVTAEDVRGLKAVSNLQFNVVQTLTGFAIKTQAGKNMGAESVITHDASNQRFTAVGLDQFGKPMAVQPAVAWQSLSKPNGSTIKFHSVGASVDVNVDRAGAYSLQAMSGSATFGFSMNVTPTLVSLRLTNTAGQVTNPSAMVEVSSHSEQFKVQAIDQFGQAMTSIPNLRWTVIRKPPGGNASIAMSSDDAVATFHRAGLYVVKAQAGTKTASITFKVSQVLTNIVAVDAVGKPIAANTPVAVAGMNFRLSAKALDQFGMAMTRQSTMAWQIIQQPQGADATLVQTGSAVDARFDRTGNYLLRASAESKSFVVSLSVGQRLTSIDFTTADGTRIEPATAVAVTGTSIKVYTRALDQFGEPVSSAAGIKWRTQSAPRGGSASVSFVTGVATIAVTRAGRYMVIADFGSGSRTITLSVNQSLTSILPLTPTNQVIAANGKLTVTGTSQRVSARALDQFGIPMISSPVFAWSQVSAPSGGSAAVNASSNHATVAFNRIGQYVLRVTAEGRSATVAFNVIASLTAIRVTPGALTVSTGERRQFQVQGVDQFRQAMTLPSTSPVSWSATQGAITTAGLFTAATQPGASIVTARFRSLVGSVSVNVAAPQPVTSLQNDAVEALVTALNADGQIDRLEMIQILRSAGSDGIVDAAELADFRFLVSSGSPYSLPIHVRELAKDVVHSNPANLRFEGQAAGNLEAGSPDTLLNKLIDKWFLGADEPLIVGAGLSYQMAAGSLFMDVPSRSDTLQGELGDCYLIASLASIADKNPDAVSNLFIDNGDGTFTVRFYGGRLGAYYTDTGLISSGFSSGTGVADYVTVNRRLPAFADGALGYSGYGLSVLSPTTALWIALAEKAYAQWNETGNAGRDGTNRYASIEGGWMSDVNAQVLGYNSTSYVFGSSTKQAMINALNADRSITLGTTPSATAGGLVGSHAYIVAGYDPLADKFSLHNPWGTAHPTPLTWAQLQANCTQFVVVDPAGSVPIEPATVQAENTPALMNQGRWSNPGVLTNPGVWAGGSPWIAEWSDEDQSRDPLVDLVSAGDQTARAIGAEQWASGRPQGIAERSAMPDRTIGVAETQAFAPQELPAVSWIVAQVMQDQVYLR